MRNRAGILVGIVVLLSLVGVAYYRSGLLNLPSVPDRVTVYDVGFDGLAGMKSFSDAVMSGVNPDADGLSASVRAAIDQIQKGEEGRGIQQLEEATRQNPTNLVVGNTLRMEVFKLKRKWLSINAGKSEIALQFPDYLQDQPIRFFRELVKAKPIREKKFQLALALVDHMLLFPALEIKAPSSVEAVEILTSIIDEPGGAGGHYVPALFARGLNYLYRPFNLVWPERIAAAPDAASKDISLAVAVGQKIGVGSNALKAELSLALGDAYAKEGKLSLARSWWQIANNMARDEKFRERVFLRLKWNDNDVRASLEQTLERQMDDLDHPLSDVRFMWE